MTDATLGLKVESGQVTAATRELDKLKVAAAGAEQQAKKLDASFSKGFMGGFVGGAAITLLSRLPGVLRDVVTEAAKIPDISRRLGLTSEQFQALGFAAKKANVEVAAVQTGLQFFSQLLSQASQGGGDLFKILQANGIAIRDTAGNLRPVNAVLTDYVELVRRAGTSQERAALLFKGFSSAGAELEPIFRNGAAGIGAAADEAERLGVILSSEKLEEIKKIDANFNALAVTISTTLKSALLDLTTGIVSLLDEMNKLENRSDETLKKQADGLEEAARKADKYFPAIELPFGLGTIGGNLGPNMRGRDAGIKAEQDRRVEAQREATRSQSVLDKNKPPVVLPPGPPAPPSAADRAAEAWQRSLANQQRNIALLNAEADSVGKTAGQRARAATVANLEAKAIDANRIAKLANTAVTDSQREAINKLADATAAATQRLDDMRERNAELIASMDDIRDTTRGIFSDIAHGIAEGKSGKDIFKNLFTNISGKFIDNGVASLTQGLLGKDGKMGGGIFGDMISGILGGGAGARGSSPANPMFVAFGGAGGSGGGLIGDLIKTATNDNGAGAGIGIGPLGSVSRGQDLLPVQKIAEYIKLSATAHGIDPAIALRVAKSEGGLSSWNLQSGVMKNGIREPSFGPFQLLKGGQGTGFPAGLGNRAMAAGIDPAQARFGPAGIDFAMKEASQKGWGQWFGAKASGIGNQQGIGAVPAAQMAAAQQQLKALGKATEDAGKAATDATGSLKDIAAPITDATKNLGNLGQGAAQTAPALGQAAGGIDQLSNSLQGGGQGGSTGLIGFLGKLFGFSGGNSSGGGFDWNFDTSSMASGFARGGFTGHGGIYQPAGVVHRGEIVWSQSDIAKAGGIAAVEGMRMGLAGYARGGLVDAPRMRRASNQNGGGGRETRITVINQAVGDGYEAKQRSSSTDTIESHVIEIMKKATASGKMDQTQGARFGNSPQSVKR